MTWTDDLRRILQRLRGERPEAQPPGGIECHEAMAKIFDWLDNELDPQEAECVGEHLQTCARCYPRLKFEQAFCEALKRASSNETAGADLQQQILDALVEEGYTTD